MQNIYGQGDWVLVDDDTGREIKIGDVLTSFRGEREEVTGFDPPRHPGSTGHVNTINEHTEHGTSGHYYPGVFGCHYVDREVSR